MNQLKKKNIQRLFYGGTGLCWPQFWELHDIIDHDVIERLDLKYYFFILFLSANDNSKRKRHEHRSVAESASDW